MAMTKSTPGTPGARAKPRTETREAIPAYGMGGGVLSFRHSLLARERKAIDRALEIVGRCLREPQDQFTSPCAVKEYLRLHLAGEQRELFAVLFLDSQNRALSFEIMFTGTLTQTSVYPREVASAAMRTGASGVILAHNHPSGTVQPSSADEALTQTLKSALALVDVRVLDHVIVGGTEALSMAEEGLL
jgi:DNA repair protein RadC